MTSGLLAEIDGVRSIFQMWVSQNEMPDELSNRYCDAFFTRVDRLLALRPANVSEAVQLSALVVELMDYDDGNCFNHPDRLKKAFSNIASVECVTGDTEVTPVWSPRVFERRPVPDDFADQKASYYTMQHLIDAAYNAGNAPNCQDIWHEVEDWVEGFRSHQSAIVKRVAERYLNQPEGVDVLASAFLLEHWDNECGTEIWRDPARLRELATKLLREDQEVEQAAVMVAAE